jgi:hypothetical protein
MLENKTGYSIEKKIKKRCSMKKECTNIDYLAISHEPVHPAQDLQAADNFLGQLHRSDCSF